jgi:UDP-glucose 4-epimerase
LKACIFGPGGYLGSALVVALRARGDDLQLISSQDGGINLTTGLLAEDVQVRAGTDVVYYLSQSPHYRQVPQAAAHLLTVNCVAAVQAAMSASRAGVRRFVYASTGNVYSPSFAALAEEAPVRRDSWYPLSKLMAEEALALFRDRMDVTSVRIFGIYGPRQTDKLIPMLVDSVRQGKQVFAERNPQDPSDLDGLKVSPIYIDDAVSALLKLGTGPAAPVLNLAGDRVLSVAEIAEAIGKGLNKPVRVQVADKARQTDLVADIGLLNRLQRPTFTPFEEGIAQVLEVYG